MLLAYFPLVAVLAASMDSSRFLSGGRGWGWVYSSGFAAARTAQSATMKSAHERFVR
jgi:hypothetical protein